MWITHFLKVTQFLFEFNWNRKFNLLKALSVLRLNVSPIPVQIVESRGAPLSYAVLKKFHGLAWWKFLYATGLEFVVCVYTYSHQCYASGWLVDPATLQFKPNCNMGLNSWMSKVIVNS